MTEGLVTEEEEEEKESRMRRTRMSRERRKSRRKREGKESKARQRKTRKQWPTSEGEKYDRPRKGGNTQRHSKGINKPGKGRGNIDRHLKEKNSAETLIPGGVLGAAGGKGILG